MTDTKLRELERRWKETQSVEDEAAYLLERVRVGDLEREKLELAAYCGHEGAREAVGAMDSIRLPQGNTSISFCCVIADRELLPRWESSPFLIRGEEGLGEAPRIALNALIAWIRCPDDEHRTALVDAQLNTHRAWKWAADNFGFSAEQDWGPCYFVWDLTRLALEEVEVEDLFPILESCTKRTVSASVLELLTDEALNHAVVDWLLTSS